MKKLPIGIQSFKELIEKGFLYIDKTEKIFELIDNSKMYFLSRPRRFGKSLLINTLREIFLGNQYLFKDLWIEHKIEWKKYPIIQLSFAISDYKELGLKKSIEIKLLEVAKQYEIEIDSENLYISNQFKELIQKLEEKHQEQVVILIDEYDKPIIDFLGEDEKQFAITNRDILKEFYSPIKDLDASIRFFFLTGVSKFSKVSIFSELNHLNDLTLNRLGETLVGYTEDELYHYFEENITKISTQKQTSKEEIKISIKAWYNGYSFGGARLYNPFSILKFMSDGSFNNYWFETGTPTFLIKLLAEGGYYDMDNIETDIISLGNFRIEKLDPVTVLFQTGYLTLKEQLIEDIYSLGYPNKEVKNAMLKLLLAEYAELSGSEPARFIIKIKQAFDRNDLESFFIHLNSLFGNIPYQIFETKKESYYHSIIFLTFTLLGYYADSEVSTAIGRIDVTIKTKDSIYLLEFKVDDSATNALKQIKDNQYYQKYLTDERKIYLIGVACNQKQIKEYLVEELKKPSST